MTYFCAYRGGNNLPNDRCGAPATSAVELPLPAKLLARYDFHPIEVGPDDFRCDPHKELLQSGGLGNVIEFIFDSSQPAMANAKTQRE